MNKSKRRTQKKKKKMLVSLTSVPEKVMERIILETFPRHRNGKRITRTSQHGFTKGVIVDQIGNLL